MVESLVSHQGQNGDAKGDLQAFQEWACWVENQAAVTTSLPCTPSMICPTGWDGCGTLSLLSIGLITVSSLLGHCVPTEKWGHSVPKEGQENSFTGVCRARSSDHILLGCSKDLSFPSGSRSHRLPLPWGYHRTVLPMCQPLLWLHPEDDPAETLLPPLSSLSVWEGTSPYTRIPTTKHYCVKPVRFQHCAWGSPRWKILAQRFCILFKPLLPSLQPVASPSLVG